MSLINEALKKAQHQRSGPPADLPPMPGSSDGSHAARRGRGLPARAVVWIAAGGGAVVVIAVLVTIALVRREPAPPPAAAPVPPAALPSSPAPLQAAPVRTAAAEPAAASPVIVAPVITVPTLPPAAPPPSEAKPIAAATPPPAATTPSLAPSGQDIRILTLIDALRVTGIRSSGGDSKVLMNDRVYRINDVVDYALGLRLTRVAADGLTFTDANGATYVKNF